MQCVLNKRLVQFHARATGIGKEDVHTFPLQRGHENLATLHRLAELAARGLGFPFRFAHHFAWLVAG